MQQRYRVRLISVVVALSCAIVAGCSQRGRGGLSAADIRAAGGDSVEVVSAAELPIELTYPQSDDQGNYAALAEPRALVVSGLVASADLVDEIEVNGASVQAYRVEGYVPFGADGEEPVYRFHAPVVVSPEDAIVVTIRTGLKEIAGSFAPDRDHVVSRLVALRKATPEDPWRATRLGSAQYAIGAYEEAIGSLDQALASGQELLWACFRLGMAYLSQGMADEAMASLDEAIRIAPALPDPYHARGLVHYSAGRYPEAIVALLDAADSAPSWAEPLVGLGLSYYAQGELDEAAGSFEEAIELWPSWASPHYGLGLVYLDQGRVEDAMASIDRGLALGPWPGGHHVKLAEKLLARGEAVAADRHLAIAEAIGDTVPAELLEQVRAEVTEPWTMGDWPWGPRVAHGMRAVQGRGLDDVAEAVSAERRATE